MTTADVVRDLELAHEQRVHKISVQAAEAMEQAQADLLETKQLFMEKLESQSQRSMEQMNSQTERFNALCEMATAVQAQWDEEKLLLKSSVDICDAASGDGNINDYVEGHG